jgi:hypothetical protein
MTPRESGAIMISLSLAANISSLESLGLQQLEQEAGHPGINTCSHKPLAVLLPFCSRTTTCLQEHRALFAVMEEVLEYSKQLHDDVQYSYDKFNL